VTTDVFADAYQAIGKYLCAFSRMEQELGESIKAVLGLQKNEASDAIVVALGDVARKASLVRAAIQDAKNADGSDVSAKLKEFAETKMKSVFKCNDDRVKLAHSLLDPQADGSVELVRLKITDGKITGRDAIPWSYQDFEAKIQQTNVLTEELETLNGELRSFKYSVPNVGWMSTDFFTPTPLGVPRVLLESLSHPVQATSKSE